MSEEKKSASAKAPSSTKVTDDKSADKAKENKKESAQEELREVKTEKVVFKGEYIKAIGRRKTAVAQVRVYKKGKGDIVVNNLPINKYFHENKAALAVNPLKLTGKLKDFDLSVLVKGGGVNAQAEAVRHGISRVLVLIDEELKPVLKVKGWLTRDSRKVERKKPGLKKARKSPQWSKR